MFNLSKSLFDDSLSIIGASPAPPPPLPKKRALTQYVTIGKYNYKIRRIEILPQSESVSSEGTRFAAPMKKSNHKPNVNYSQLPPIPEDIKENYNEENLLPHGTSIQCSPSIMQSDHMKQERKVTTPPIAPFPSLGLFSSTALPEPAVHVQQDDQSVEFLMETFGAWSTDADSGFIRTSAPTTDKKVEGTELKPKLEHPRHPEIIAPSKPPSRPQVHVVEMRVPPLIIRLPKTNASKSNEKLKKSLKQKEKVTKPKQVPIPMGLKVGKQRIEIVADFLSQPQFASQEGINTLKKYNGWVGMKNHPLLDGLNVKKKTSAVSAFTGALGNKNSAFRDYLVQVVKEAHGDQRALQFKEEVVPAYNRRAKNLRNFSFRGAMNASHHGSIILRKKRERSIMEVRKLRSGKIIGNPLPPMAPIAE